MRMRSSSIDDIDNSGTDIPSISFTVPQENTGRRMSSPDEGVIR